MDDRHSYSAKFPMKLHLINKLFEELTSVKDTLNNHSFKNIIVIIMMKSFTVCATIYQRYNSSFKNKRCENIWKILRDNLSSYTPSRVDQSEFYLPLILGTYQ